MGIATRWPIFWLTLRQFGAGKAVWVTGFFAGLPLLLAVLYRVSARVESPRAFLAGTFMNLLAPTILPLAALILATTALGNELEDRTLIYLTLKPLARARIILAKYLAALLVACLTFVPGLVLAWLVAEFGRDGTVEWRSLLAALAATLLGAAGYNALFLLVSLVAARALLIGIIYTLLWESALARFIPSLRFASLRYYIQSLFARLLDDPDVPTGEAARYATTILVLLVLIVGSLTIATLRLRRMDLD